jgi:hypothetical protein
MITQETQISVKGRQVAVPAVTIDTFVLTVTGRWLRSAAIKSEDYVLADPATNPDRLVAGLKEQRVSADLFTFVQRPPDIIPRFSYPMRWDNVAALPILGYSEWWEKRLNQDTRRCVRIALKRGLVVRPVTFDNEFVEGIRGIYNESPVRQGREFWHYGKDFETVKQENGTFVERSEFLGAYVGSELVGFLKMVYVGKTASIMQILSKTSHYERRPMNALMAKAVEICNEKQMSFLLYRKYVYHGGLPDSLTEFKRRNGFEQVNVPRYYVPLSAKGRVAVALGLQLGVVALLPKGIVSALRNIRSRLHQRRQRGGAVQGSDA